MQLVSFDFPSNNQSRIFHVFVDYMIIQLLRSCNFGLFNSL